MLSFNIKPAIKKVAFGEEQLQALKTLTEFIKSEEQAITLCGSAGTGKTTILRELIEYLDDEMIIYSLAAPTHKAKLVMELLTGEGASTVHQLLALSPNIEIFELDFRDLVFLTDKSKDSSCIPYKGVVIIDECSMINDELFDLLINKCSSCKSKLIFVGDIKQIQPVKAKTTSKVFNLPNTIFLNTVYRQAADSPVLDVLTTLREKPINKFESIQGDSDSIIVTNSANNFIQLAAPLLKEAVEMGDVLYVKLLAYTNARVKAFNDVARKLIFEGGSQNEFVKGEILTGYDNFEYNNYKFWNSLDYVIKNEPILVKRRIPNFGEYLYGYDLILYDSVYKTEKPIFVLSRNNDENLLVNLASYIENTRLKALDLKTKGKKSNLVWKRYFETIQSFATPFNLFYDNRVIKKKTFDYGYASTVHKA